jgi:hypothetical protein
MQTVSAKRFPIHMGTWGFEELLTNWMHARLGQLSLEASSTPAHNFMMIQNNLRTVANDAFGRLTSTLPISEHNLTPITIILL